MYVCFADSKSINKNGIIQFRIVLATEGTAGLLYFTGLKSGAFSHIFIDEGGQSIEPEALLPLGM